MSNLTISQMSLHIKATFYDRVMPMSVKMLRLERKKDLNAYLPKGYTKSKTEVTASVQEEKNQNTQEVKNELFLISTIQSNVRIFRYTLPLTKRQTDTHI